MIIDKKRTQILAEKFFSISIVIDYLNNVYKLSIVSELTLNSYISVEEVLEIINRLLNRKTAESNKILNEVLKSITLKINTELIYKIYAALTCDLLSA